MQINLDKKEIYYTGDLNRQQYEVLLDWLKKNDTGWEETDVEELEYLYGYDSLRYSNESWEWELNEEQTKNAKELFYTLENVQVDCRELIEEQIREMCDVYESNGYKQWTDPDALIKTDFYNYLRIDWANEFYLTGESGTKNTITYEKFMELFGENEKLPPYKKASLKWNYDTLVGDVIETTDEVSPISSREKELKKTLKHLLKKDIILTPKQYKKLWKK